MILNASLHTSFWNRACEIGVTPYLFSYFKVHFCSAVRSEIITTNVNESRRLYPQVALFHLLEEDGRLFAQDPQRTLTKFGAGEACGVALAFEQQWILLINDYRPLEFARALGVKCISVPAFCLLLYAQEKVSYAAFSGYLQRLVSTTTPRLIAEAEQIASKVTLERGDSK